VHRNCKQDLSLGGYTSRTAWAAKKDLSRRLHQPYRMGGKKVAYRKKGEQIIRKITNSLVRDMTGHA
jgi:hypothetical protein